MHARPRWPPQPAQTISERTLPNEKSVCTRTLPPTLLSKAAAAATLKLGACAVQWQRAARARKVPTRWAKLYVLAAERVLGAAHPQHVELVAREHVEPVGVALGAGSFIAVLSATAAKATHRGHDNGGTARRDGHRCWARDSSERCEHGASFAQTRRHKGALTVSVDEGMRSSTDDDNDAVDDGADDWLAGCQSSTNAAA